MTDKPNMAPEAIAPATDKTGAARPAPAAAVTQHQDAPKPAGETVHAAPPAPHVTPVKPAL